MKLITLLSLLLSFNTFAKCKTTVEFNLFSNPFAEVRNTKQYSKMLKQFKKYGLKVTENADEADFTTIIEAGVEDLGNGKVALLSHFQIYSAAGNLRYEQYKNKKYSAEEEISNDQIVKFVKKHLRKKLATCGL